MTAEVGRSRIAQIQASLADEQLDGLVLRLPENVVLATSYLPQIPGMGLVLIPLAGSPVMFVPEYEAEEVSRKWSGEIATFDVIRNDRPPPIASIEQLLSEHGRALELIGGRIGLELGFETVAPPSMAGEPAAVAAPTKALCRRAFGKECDLIDMTDALEDIRAVKTADEIARIRVVNEVARLGLETFKEVARPGATEVEVMAEVERAVAVGGSGYAGSRVARAWATVYSGPDLAKGWQYFRSRTRMIEAGDVVMLEMGTTVDGYWADHTRTVVAGRATSRQRAAYEAARAATAAAFRAAIPGATGAGVDDAARSACEAAGFDQFPHHTGHGVGFRYHESRPQLVPGGEHRVREGNVIAAEPGIYGDDLYGGFRYEDNAVVTESGAEVLSETAFDLDL